VLRENVVWWRATFGFWLFAGVGCSSSSAVEPPLANGGGVATREQVLASCESFAERLCAGSASCCNQAYGAFSEAGCKAYFRAQVCEPAADAVANGFATYDESAVDPCLAAHAQANEICIPDWEQVLSLRKAIWSACKVVRGTASEGKSCTASVTCLEPEGEKTANCVSGVCRVLEILPENAACPFQSGSVSTCDSGLYCTATQSADGVCQPVLALGASCSGILGDPSCGFGNYCDLEEKICKRTVNRGGPSCRQGFECVSFDCDLVTSTCAPAPAVISEAQCSGASGL